MTEQKVVVFVDHGPHAESMLLPLLNALVKRPLALVQGQGLPMPRHLRIAADHAVMGKQITRC